MELYEELVQLYLTVFEGCIVMPQVPILSAVDGTPWYAYPDLLALEFQNQLIQIVEVTKSMDHAAGPKLAEKLKANHRENVEHYLKTKTLNNHLGEFRICWRFFVRAIHVERLKNHPDFKQYEESGRYATVMAVEEVFNAIRDKMP
jgi:hypothetical protein